VLVLVVFYTGTVVSRLEGGLLVVANAVYWLWNLL
jgi:hypothetical protein